MTFISIESPYSNVNPNIVNRNVCYALLAIKDSINNYNEASYAAHLLHTQLVFNGKPYYVGDWICRIPIVLNYFDGIKREKVLKLTNNVRKKADKIVLYVDFGITPGMEHARKFAIENNIPIEERNLPEHMLKSLPNVNKQNSNILFLAISSLVVSLGIYLWNVL